MAEARMATAEALPRMLAEAVNKLHLRIRTTWCFTKAGRISSDTAKLRDFMPGNFARSDKDYTLGMLSSGLQMAKSLDLPPNLRILLRSDSTLTVYGTDAGIAEGLGTKKRSILYDLQWAHRQHYWDAGFLDGQTLSDLHASLAKDPQEIASADVTTAGCNVNAPKGSNTHTVFAPGSDQGIEMVKLCKELRAHKRPLLVVAVRLALGTCRQRGTTWSIRCSSSPAPKGLW